MQMKKIILSAFSGMLVLASCQQPQPSFKLSGTINDATNKTIVVNVIDGTGINTIDTLTIADGVVDYNTTFEEPVLLSVSEAGTRNSVYFFGENLEYTINGSAEKLNEAIIIGGEAFDLYKKVSDAESNLRKISGELRTKYNEANKAGDTIKAKAIYEEYGAEAKKVDEIKTEVTKGNPTSSVAAYLHYNMYRNKPLNEMKEGLSLLDSSLVTNTYYKALNQRIEKLESVAVGKIAPDFTQNDQEGNPVSLSSFKGKYLLIDFWASWCGPCRHENPNVVKLYTEFKDKGFDILGVSLDQKKEAWLKAIEDDQLTWSHVSDLKGWKNEVANLYGVSSIPHTVLLDKEGKIIAKNLRGDALKEKVAELLN
jgi:peroxiredoxin